eukprot:13701158-Alexandrium_andersonii.AAC.1
MPLRARRKNNTGGGSGRPGRGGSGLGPLDAGPLGFERPMSSRQGIGNGLGWPCHGELGLAGPQRSWLGVQTSAAAVFANFPSSRSAVAPFV